MKKRFLILAALTSAVTTLGAVLPERAEAGTCRPGQQTQVLWQGSWYSATMLRAQNGLCYITYNGYDSSWDEWVEPVRIADGYQVGSAVSIYWQGDWYSGQIIDARDGLYKVHYSGYDSSWDEWVDSSRLQ